jgi:hypothetical protein
VWQVTLADHRHYAEVRQHATHQLYSLQALPESGFFAWQSGSS